MPANHVRKPSGKQIKRSKERKVISKGVKVGDICSLSVETPYGLHESFDGGWYLVTDNGDCKIAIVLAHAELPSFTCLRLKPYATDGGRWWGPFKIAAGLPSDQDRSPEVGLLSSQAHPILMLQCHTQLVYQQWLEIGCVTKLREDFDYADLEGVAAEYDCWTIIRAHDNMPVVTRTEQGLLELGASKSTLRDYVAKMDVQPLSM